MNDPFAGMDFDRLRQDILETLGIPSRIGPYEVKGELGRGGMGIVLLARDTELDREVALKLLPSALALRKAAADRFERECRAVARLDHPSIVRFFRTGRHDGIPYAVMEYLPGRTLDQEPPAADIPALLRRFAELADALHAAHGQGVVHRDVKPSNIMAAPDGRLRLLDFGLAMLDDADRVTFSGDLLGTPQAMSPEQVTGRRDEVGPAADLYGLGVALYFALTGAWPLTGSSRAEIFRKALFVDPEPPSRRRAGLSADIDAVVLQCLRKDPRDRYGSAAALAVDLRALADGRPVAARRWSAPRRLFNAARRVPDRVGHGAAALAILGFAGLAVIFLLLLGLLRWVGPEPLALTALGISTMAGLTALCLALRGAGTVPLRQDPLRVAATVVGTLLLTPGTLGLAPYRTWDLGSFSMSALYLMSLLVTIVWMHTCLTRSRVLELAACGLFATLGVFFWGAVGQGRMLLLLALLPPVAGGLFGLLSLLVFRVSRPRFALWFGGHVLAAAAIAAGFASGGSSP